MKIFLLQGCWQDVFEVLGKLLSLRNVRYDYHWMQRLKCFSSSLLIQGRISSWFMNRDFEVFGKKYQIVFSNLKPIQLLKLWQQQFSSCYVAPRFLNISFSSGLLWFKNIRKRKKNQHEVDGWVTTVIFHITESLLI